MVISSFFEGEDEKTTSTMVHPAILWGIPWLQDPQLGILSKDI